MKEIKGLIIDTPHIDRILSGEKMWEMRSTTTKQRDLIGLIRKGQAGKLSVSLKLLIRLGRFQKKNCSITNQSTK